MISDKINFKQHLITEEKITLFTPEDLFKRLKQIGWTIEHRENHYVLYAPKTAKPQKGFGTGGTELGMSTMSTNSENWQKNYYKSARQILRQFPALEDFLYLPRFFVPANFNVSTQDYKHDSKSHVMSTDIIVGNLFKFLDSKNEDPENALVGKIVNGKIVDVASFSHGKLELVHSDGSQENIDWHKPINIDLSQLA